jgi:hypothetical protein
LGLCQPVKKFRNLRIFGLAALRDRQLAASIIKPEPPRHEPPASACSAACVEITL